MNTARPHNIAFYWNNPCHHPHRKSAATAPPSACPHSLSLKMTRQFTSRRLPHRFITATPPPQNTSATATTWLHSNGIKNYVTHRNSRLDPTQTDNFNWRLIEYDPPWHGVTVMLSPCSFPRLLPKGNLQIGSEGIKRVHLFSVVWQIDITMTIREVAVL